MRRRAAIFLGLGCWLIAFSWGAVFASALQSPSVQALLYPSQDYEIPEELSSLSDSDFSTQVLAQLFSLESCSSWIKKAFELILKRPASSQELMKALFTCGQTDPLSFSLALAGQDEFWLGRSEAGVFGVVLEIYSALVQLTAAGRWSSPLPSYSARTVDSETRHYLKQREENYRFIKNKKEVALNMALDLFLRETFKRIDPAVIIDGSAFSLLFFLATGKSLGAVTKQETSADKVIRAKLLTPLT